ncbi:MAG: DNA replication/repair protein RecF [Rhodospirillales bacterium]|nr:DNA replication/repair protein RecF [Rhodospirillales bacterium]
MELARGVTRPSGAGKTAAWPHARAPLSVAKLTLKNFRSYGFQRIEASAGPVVLAGPNGAGKTNVLEALSFLAPGRGLRGALVADVARRVSGTHAEETWGVAAELATPRGPVELGTGAELSPSGEALSKRLVRVNGAPAKGQASLAEHVSLFWLTPEMDGLFTGSPSERRRFLDRTVFGFDPAHAARLSAYGHAMRERARLLAAGSADPEWLTALEDTMATAGVAIAAARVEAADRLASASGFQAFPAAELAVEGEVERWLAGGPALSAEDRMRDALKAARRVDAETGRTSNGPHRSDLAVRHKAKEQPAGTCSTGEQKALLIALVLANARAQREANGIPPILLLDEVASHLDRAAREALFEEIVGLGVQAWLTGTESNIFQALAGRSQLFEIEDSTVVPSDWRRPSRVAGS